MYSSGLRKFLKHYLICVCVCVYLGNQDVVLQLLPGLHDANDRRLDLMLSVVVHLLPSLFPLWVGLALLSGHWRGETEGRG